MTLTQDREATPLAHIKALVTDCDGVLTDGLLYYSQTGERSLTFNARDGMGFGLLKKAGYKLAILSGRPIDIAQARHLELGVDIFEGQCKDKAASLKQMAQTWGLEPSQIAYLGDDLPDLSAFSVVGLRCAVKDAASELINRADWVSDAKGGHGAFRQLAEELLKAAGHWQRLVSPMLF